MRGCDVKLNLREEGFLEGFVKVVAFFEVVYGVGIGFAEYAVVDEFEDDVAEVFAIFDIPVFKDGESHGAVLEEGVFADAFEEFLSGYVLGGLLLFGVVWVLVFDGEFEGVADEEVSASGVFGVVFGDFSYDIVEVFHKVTYPEFRF